MNTFAQKACIHANLMMLILVGGAFVVAGWIPPFSPDGSFDELAANFDDQNVRVAAAMLFFGGPFFVLPCAAIAAQLRRIEGEHSVLAWSEMLLGAVGTLAIQLPGMIWLALCYYDGIDPSTVAALNAAAWFLLLGAVGTAVVQNSVIAMAILGSDGSVYPRWLGYLNVYCATGLLVGVLLPFFHDGPFAWNGVVGFWILFVDFSVWVVVMWIQTAAAISDSASAVDQAEKCIEQSVP